MEIGNLLGSRRIRRSRSREAASFPLQFFLDKNKKNVYNFNIKFPEKKTYGENKGIISYGYTMKAAR